ncbi:MAG: ester cyclase [Chloroflexi bacterium]|nr:ester cyclase [Chloroflexota bacterium]
MSIEANKQIIRNLVEEVYNGRHIEAIPNYFIAGSFLAGSAANLIRGMSASFPDFQMTIEDLIAEGDKVVNHMTMRGTHLGEFFGHPPTGKPVLAGGISIYTIRDGKIVTMASENNILILYQQLGITPVIEQE